MNSDLRDLYQEVILDHNKSPRNFGPLGGANHAANGDNPLCGDKVKVYLTVEDGVLRDIAFEGVGCAISTASASIMTETVKGKTVEEVRSLFSTFHGLLTGDPSTTPEVGPELGKMAVFAGVREYPVRVKCATLAWHTLDAALNTGSSTVSTE